MALNYNHSPRIDDFLIPNLISFTTNYGRRVESFIPASGDGNEALDKGKIPTKHDLVFALVGTPDQVRDQVAQFKALQDKADNRVFVHPIFGPVVVKLGDHTIDVQPDRQTVNTTLIEVQPFTKTVISTEEVTQEEVIAEILATSEATGSDLPPDLGEFDEVFVGEPPDLGEFPSMDLSEAYDRTQAWTSESSPASMNRDLEQMLSKLDAAERSLGRQKSNEAWEAIVQINSLTGALIGRARTITAQDRLQWGQVTVRGKSTLAQEVAHLYGEKSVDVYDQIRVRSNISDPWNLNDGAVLQLPNVPGLRISNLEPLP